ncbi:MAG: YdcF family protein [Eubacteriaceae bacterium]|nr:YdcF family protein [Eubacteriaceae bacterium]
MKRKGKILLYTLIGLILYLSVNALSICLYGRVDERRRADVIIVLGAAAYNGEVSPVYRERINHAVFLYNEGYAKEIILTGGMGEGNDISDSRMAALYAISMGIPQEDIFTEDFSKITRENLIYAKQIMEDRGMESAIVVSDPLHMKIAIFLAKECGISAYSSPTPTTRYISLKTKLPFLMRELFFYVGYKALRVFYVFHPQPASGLYITKA